MSTFATYFSADNHQLWTSTLIDMTPQVAKEILAKNVDIMALVETCGGIENSKGETIPHTDNLLTLIENLNKGQDPEKVQYRIATYAQFTNPAAETMPHLNRGNAIIYNLQRTLLYGSFTIEITSEKRGKKTVRRYPVCIFGSSQEPEIAVCAAHVSGYAWKDAAKDGDPENIKVGDRELEEVLKVLSLDLTNSDSVTVSINGESYKPGDTEVTKFFTEMKVKELPIVIGGDFNQDFNKYSIEYTHEYRFPTFIPHEGETVAKRYKFENGYTIAGKIHPTAERGISIDGFLFKGITKATLISDAYNPENATSDHGMVVMKV